MDLKNELQPIVMKSTELSVKDFGVIKVAEILHRGQTENMSVARIELNGVNDRVRNTISDASYYVLTGEGKFILGEGENRQKMEVKQGDLVFIPKGTWYQDSGEMTMLSFCAPAFNPEQVERK